MNTQQLEDRLAGLAEGLPSPASTSLTKIQHRARARRWRRHSAVGTFMVFAVLLVGVAVADLLPPAPVEIGPADQAQQVPTLELADHAVWLSPQVDGARAAAGLFAQVALGWDDPDIELGTEEAGPVWVTISERPPATGRVEVLMTPTAASGVWQIVQVGSGTSSLGADPGMWRLEGEGRHGAAAADLYLRHAGQTWHIPVSPEELRSGLVNTSRHGLAPDGLIDSNLVIYRDESGRAIGAAGGHSTTADEPRQPSASPPGPPTTFLGALPDGTVYQLTLPASWAVKTIDGISGLLVWADGPAAGWAVGVTSWQRREHLGTELDPGLSTAPGTGARVVIPAGRWAMVVTLYEHSADREDELRQVEGRELHGHPVLDLPTSLRWPTPGEYPVQLGVSYPGATVYEGCSERFARCSPDGQIMVGRPGSGQDMDPDADLAGAEILIVDGR